MWYTSGQMSTMVDDAERRLPKAVQEEEKEVPGAQCAKATGLVNQEEKLVGETLLVRKTAQCRNQYPRRKTLSRL